MICPKCRVKIANNDKYCPRCGEILDHSDLERLGNKLENNLLNIYSNKIWGRLNVSVGYLLFNFIVLFVRFCGLRVIQHQEPACFTEAMFRLQKLMKCQLKQLLMQKF